MNKILRIFFVVTWWIGFSTERLRDWLFWNYCNWLHVNNNGDFFFVYNFRLNQLNFDRRQRRAACFVFCFIFWKSYSFLAFSSNIVKVFFLLVVWQTCSNVVSFSNSSNDLWPRASFSRSWKSILSCFLSSLHRMNASQ